jgi:DNA-binding XRE family transcriptional regulator
MIALARSRDEVNYKMAEDVKITTKQKLIGCRNMIGYTQDDMAKYLGITRVTYNRKENKPEKFSFSEKEAIKILFKNSIPNYTDVFL